ncbi:MAG: hypothetical protein ACI9HU_000640 [Colwellia sp.]|jgi:hypothetical protein
MKLDVSAYSGRGYPSAAISIEMPEMFEQAFDRVDVCDDGMVRMACGGISNAEMKVVTKLRKDAAKDMSEYIAKLLIQHMTKNDTKNGYPI